LSSPTKIRAITFDAGGTLMAPWPSVGHVYAEAALRYCAKEISAEEINRRFRAEWKRRKNFNHGREDWAALVDRVFEGLTTQPPSSTFFSELYDRFAEAEAWRVFEDVLPAIDAAAASGISIGVVSNWDERLSPLLEKLGLMKYFEAVIASCEAGFSKPSPVIFGHASKKLGVPPEFILHVGDDFEDDFKGAKSAGFQAVLVERGLGEPREGVIRSLLELRQWLE
jgi:putative hydrolase of the HAD superfamily